MVCFVLCAYWGTVIEKVFMNIEIEPNRPKRFWAGGFLYNSETHEVFLHQRDSNTKINPNKWAFFGGLNENEESPEQCYVRELKEEIGLEIKKDNVFLLCEYLNEELSTYRIVFYSLASVSKDDLTLGEGAGFDWIPLDSLADYDLTEKTKLDMQVFRQRMAF